MKVEERKLLSFHRLETLEKTLVKDVNQVQMVGDTNASLDVIETLNGKETRNEFRMQYCKIVIFFLKRSLE